MNNGEINSKISIFPISNNKTPDGWMECGTGDIDFKKLKKVQKIIAKNLKKKRHD